MSHFDPVCGMQVDAAHAAATAEHDGERYPFCSQACLEQFRRHPEQFVEAKRPDRSGRDERKT